MMTVDVEDWFHILDLPEAPDLLAWDSLPSCVEHDFRKLLDLFSSCQVKVTCFFLGWIAERHPGLVKAASAGGHEIASHGYSHTLVYRMDRSTFLADARRARLLLEDQIGSPVFGYRSAGFSGDGRNAWFFETLVEAGYSYDSSVFPASHGHGGSPGARRDPHCVETPGGPIVEIPISVKTVAGVPFCVFGGGYLRLAPAWLIRKMSKSVLAEGRPVIFYIHPREINPDQPRLPMNLLRKFKSYVNLATTEAKLHMLLEEFKVVPCCEYLACHGLLDARSKSALSSVNK